MGRFLNLIPYSILRFAVIIMSPDYPNGTNDLLLPFIRDRMIKFYPNASFLNKNTEKKFQLKTVFLKIFGCERFYYFRDIK